jgi:hypothetical protein
MFNQRKEKRVAGCFGDIFQAKPRVLIFSGRKNGVQLINKPTVSEQFLLYMDG